VSPTDFSFEWAFLGLPLAAAAAYVWAARRDRPPTWRAATFATGLFLIAASLNSPLETIAAKRLLLVHLLQNALIADIAPLLILLGLTPAMRAWLDRHGARHIRARYALPAWLIAWYATHLAGFYNWALDTGWALNIEHGVLILGGLLFWWPIVSGRLSTPAGLAYLGAGFVAIVVPRARADLLEPSVLFVLRARTAPLGPVAVTRPEPRRHPDERRADDRVPPRDRLLRVAAPRRGARQRGGRIVRGRLNDT